VKREAQGVTGLKEAEEQAAAEAARESGPTGAGVVVGPGVRDAVIRGEHVEFSQGGASRIEANTVSFRQGGVGRIKTHEMSLSQGGAGFVQTGTLRLESEASAFLVLARRAEVSPGGRVFVLISGRTSGGMPALLDWRSALALVGGFLLIRRLLGILRRS
jgi:hypothetical protein